MRKNRKEGDDKYDCLDLLIFKKQINSNFARKSFTITDVVDSSKKVVAYKQGDVYVIYGYKWCSHTSKRIELLRVNFDKAPQMGLVAKIPVNTGSGFISGSEAWVMFENNSVYCDYSTNDGFLFFHFTYIP